MSNGETYVEKLTRLTFEVKNTIRRGKSSGSSSYEHNGITYNLANRPERMELVQCIADEYVLAHAETNQRRIDTWESAEGSSERPVSLMRNTALLDLLADAVLDEELMNPHPDKVTREEYPFLSERQFDRRRDNEYSLSLAENYDTTGVNRSKPERKHRTAREERFIDKLSQTKNRKINKQYKHDTSNGAITTYNLNSNGGVLTEPFVMAACIVSRYRELIST